MGVSLSFANPVLPPSSYFSISIIHPEEALTQLHSIFAYQFSSVQSLSRVLTLCDPMDCSTPDLPFHHQLLESTQTHASPRDEA